MEVYFLALSLLTVLFFILAVIKGRRSAADVGQPVEQPGGNEARRAEVVRPARHAGARNRARIRPAQRLQDVGEVEEEEREDVPEKKIGTKKAAKLEAKAEKRAQREAELREREQSKLLEEQEREEKRKQDELEEELEAKRLEKERLETEERERREHEEYLKLKAQFSVEEEGQEEAEEEDQGSRLLEFINYIMRVKVVVLEDLAAEFKLKTQEVISRIQDLQSSGQLTGVVDDRGKFIYISQNELEAVAKFIQQRGRVSLVELAECSNKLINLDPDTHELLQHVTDT